ncbi:GMC oxidoreductase [Stachybotrys elegans]|uniref:GMC oxidoreductase n=1 Tax=Stachybotrys elegans TaxID=80388 RepID=A0A8K0SQZ7_9HYPO|nr:GMC oxidoreductase [Stachybotrys elegans]
MPSSTFSASETHWDYVVVGGGLAGTVLAHRLNKLDATSKILVIEAGPNANDREDIVWPNSTNLEGGEFDWRDTTAPQPHLDNRVLPFPQGKALGGGTVINNSGWIRGDKFDYDLWGAAVNDTRWSYDGLLPYMKKSEAFWSKTINKDQHGLCGANSIQSVISTNREFPLRQQLLDSWAELGINAVPDLDGNAGHPLGVADVQENRVQGRRQIASNTHPLDKVTVLVNTTVAKIVLETVDGSLTATGVELDSGIKIKSRQVVLSAGAIRSPQILLLSGIGPKEHLDELGISVALDQPQVGKNLAEHSLIPLAFRVRDPSAGYIIGPSNPLFANEQYGWGTPTDFLVSADVPKEGLRGAIAEDEGSVPDASHPLLAHPRTFLEHVLLYVGAPDGTLATLVTFVLLTTSRGDVKLRSTDVKTPPVINPNYLSTAVDRYVAREGVRRNIKLGGSDSTLLGREVFDGEVGAPGFSTTLTPESTDAEIDARVRASLATGYHPMGSLSMGKVVDSDLKVIGVNNLRVVDASVFPVVITGHLQVATYALAEQAAEIIHGKKK